MGYVSEELKKILGGSKYVEGSSATKIRDWTPNNIKTLIIGRDYILVVNHIGGFGGSRVIRLDNVLVGQDIHEMCVNYKNPIFNVLKKRSLSCLEEIYMDEIYYNSNNTLFDLLSGYVNNLSNSRLRYYGYANFGCISAESIQNYYRSNSSVMDCSLYMVKDKLSGMNCSICDNKEWFKHYYLRPQFYEMDNDNGKLAMHFRKFELDYAKYVASIIDESKGKYIISEAFSKTNFDVLYKLGNFLSKLEFRIGSGIANNFESAIRSSILRSLKASTVIEGLTESIVKSHIDLSEENNTRVSILKALGLFSSSESKTLYNRLEKSEYGIIDTYSLMDEISYNVSQELCSKGYSDSVKVAITYLNMSRMLPKGKITNKYGIASNCSDVLGFFECLYEFSGFRL